MSSSQATSKKTANYSQTIEKAQEKDGNMFDLIQNSYMRDYVRMR